MKTIKVKLDKASRKGNHRLQAIIVIQPPDNAPRSQVEDVGNRMKEKRVNEDGLYVLGLPLSWQVKVYTMR